MRPLLATLSLGLAAAAASAQNVPAMQSLPGGLPVGSSYAPPKAVGSQLPQVGTRLPTLGRPDVAPKANGLNGTIPNQPTDPAAVVAPYPTSPKMEDKSFWDKVYDRWAGIFSTNAPAPANRVTPGIYRRARERDMNRFRRD